MSDLILTQWVEDCADYEVCEIAEEEPEIEEEPEVQVYVEPEFEGRYYKWMGGPLMLMAAAGVSLADKSYSETSWAVATGWSFAISYFTLIWFHEFIHGGPEEEDRVFDDYNLTAKVGYGGLALLTAWGRYDDNTHPSTFVANCLSILFGSMLTNKIELMHHTPEELDEETEIELEETEVNGGERQQK